MRSGNKYLLRKSKVRVTIFWFKKNFLSIATAALAVAAFLTIFIDSANEKKVNRAFISVDVSFKKFINHPTISIFNTGKTAAYDLEYESYLVVNNEKLPLNTFPVGVVNPNLPVIHNRQFSPEIVSKLFENERNTFNVKVSYDTYYGHCFSFVYPLGGFATSTDDDGNVTPTWRQQSVEEYEC